MTELPHFPSKFKSFFQPHRYKVGRGGRASAKSHTVASILVLMGSKMTLRICCGREYQKSIDESVKQLLEDKIIMHGLSDEYIVQEKAIYHKTNGTVFKFVGVKTNPTSLKSFEGIDIFWMEEAEKVSKRSWSIVIPTIRKEGSEIWITYNPDEEDDPTHTMVNELLAEKQDIVVVDINWQDNPWFPETLRRDKDHAYKTDPDGADNIWGGNVRKRSKAAIFASKCRLESFTPVTEGFPEQVWLGPYDGSDWGFSTDPVTAVRTWISPDKKKLYIEYESYGVGVENDDIVPKWKKDVPGIGFSTIFADNSRPETISHVRKGRPYHGEMFPELVGTYVEGLPVKAAKKWQGSVEDGITYLLNFEEIIIHPRCKHAWDEARLYKYKVDQLTGQVTRAIVDAWNHIWDAVRYAHEPMIIKRKSLNDVL